MKENKDAKPDIKCAHNVACVIHLLD